MGLLSMLWKGPRTSYAHAQAVMKAADQVEKAIQEEQAWLNLSFSLGETAHVDGGARHRLALSRHRTAVRACNERREALQEAVRARETWTDSVRVLREVVTALRTVDDLRGACRMERTLLGGFVPFARVEAALVALDGAPSLSDEEVSAREAFLKALQEAEAWLADSVNVDPEVAPPAQSDAFFRALEEAEAGLTKDDGKDVAEDDEAEQEGEEAD